MTSHRLHQQLLALSLPVGWFLSPVVANAQSTWTGATTNWNVATNWNPAAIPAEGSDIIINNTTTAGLTLNDGSHTVNNITFGSAPPLRISGFTLQTTQANTLTVKGGITANGVFAAVGPTFRGNFNFGQSLTGDQTVSVGGAVGSVTADMGLFLRSFDDTASATPRGTMVMNDDITKIGTGQLVLLGFDLTGAGDFIVNEGGLKFNGGGNQAFNVGGTGNITMNGSSILMISRNSGSFPVFTRPVIMNGSSSLQLGGNTDNTTLPNTWTINNASLALSVGRNFTLTGPITTSMDTTSVTRSGGDATKFLTLSGNNSNFTAPFFNNAGILNIEGPFGASISATGTATVANTVNLSAAGSIGGNVTGTLATLNLNGPVAGNVDGLSGTLVTNGAIDGNLTGSAGLNLGGESIVAGNIDLQGVNLTAPAATPASLHAETDLTVSGTNTVTLTGVVPLNTPIKVVSYDGFLAAGDQTNFTLAGGVNAYRSFSFADNTAGKSIDVSVDAGAVTWTGAVSPNWDINTTANWSGTSDKFFQLDAVTFPNIASNKLINLPGNVSPRSITFQNDLGNDYRIAGTGFITGGTTITKNGTGVTELGGANGQNFTGPIAVNSGVLRMVSRDAFGASSGITVASGGQVDLGGQAPGTLASGSYTYTIAGDGPAPGNAGAIVNNIAALDQNAGIKNLVLTGNASLGGSFRFDIGRTTATGSGVITGNGHTLTVKNSAVVAFRGDASGSPINIVANAGRIYTEDTDNGLGGATGTVTVNSGARAGTFGNRTVVTPVTLNAGGILHNQGGGVGTWTGTITLAGAGATIEADGGQNIIISGNLTESGGARDLVKTGNARLIFTSNAGYTGNTTITNGFVQVGNGGTTGSINGNPIDLVSATSGFIVNRSDDLTINNVISGLGPAANAADPGAVTKVGTGTLTVTAANTYSGVTRFGAGTVAIGSNATVFGTGLLDFRGAVIRSSDATNRVIANPVSYSADTTLGSAGTGNLLFTGAVGTGGGAKGFNVQNAITEFSGVLSGTASTATITKSGPGTLIFSNENLYLQTTTISQGVLQMGNGGTTGSLSTTNVINNASLVINRQAPEGFDIFDFNNIVSGSGSLTYSGPDTINVNGNSTYTGDTILTDGIFSMAFPSLADGSSLRMTSDATIDLFHNLTDTVNKFFVNGTAQAVGTWGRVGSIAALGADFESPLITGDGLLEVTSTGSATPYDDWATDAGLTSGNSAPTANPDGDGFVNLAEFGFNGNPLSGATGGKIVVKIASVGGQQALTLTLPVRTVVAGFSGGTFLTATGDGVTYTIEAGDNLGTWGLDVDEVIGTDATAIQTDLPEIEDGWTYRTFRSPGAIGGDPIEFIRARVE